ncbi:hypothetical protein GCM10007385_46560 [Tateyamaria omphalii]|uniref:DUF3560 domain-containing protein n=1 Tax=Tateyamaria omphalii TaxID=299262 RepID=UPI00167C1326|nr:DUF3560 domain-containing protein [Tateyamaria omphalii]GGX72465.1 hypothetical protein GCM10007385_46560 [Tateyamaria omphalii]
MNRYEEKQEARRARLEAAADRADARSNDAYKRADLSEEATGIPFGQPILAGHHSEGRHRAVLKRADNAMRKSVEEGKRAGALRAKAAAVGTGGISSDDPDAVDKLREKLANLETSQANMKAANKIVRKWAKKGVTPESAGEDFDTYAAELAAVADHFSAQVARELLKPQWGDAGPIGFAPYQLTNNNAEINRLKKRIAQLEKASTRETKEYDFQGVCRVVENAGENRLQFFFDGKPDENTRAVMKSNGFRWAPSQEAWQRQLTGNALRAGRSALRALGVDLSTM